MDKARARRQRWPTLEALSQRLHAFYEFLRMTYSSGAHELLLSAEQRVTNSEMPPDSFISKTWNFRVTLLVNGREQEAALECACCRRPIEPLYAYRGMTDKFYCGEFCADSEIDEFRAPPNEARDISSKEAA